MLLLALACCAAGSAAPAARPKHVLYLVVDDLRAEMRVAYNQPHVVTPNFDRLANESLVFSRAYGRTADTSSRSVC